MFKNLKKKLEQGVAQTSLRAAAAVSAISKTEDQNSSRTEKETQDVGRPLAQSTPQKLTQESGIGEEVPSRVLNSSTTAHGDGKFTDIPVGQLVDIPLEGGGESSYETASDIDSVRGDDTPRGPRSRTSSVSSVMSDSSFFQVPNFSSHYIIPSDVESELDESSYDFSGISKEDLYTYVKKFERRAFKYKSKFMELASHYKEMLAEREKLKNTLTQSQDRAFRRMSELREQIQLDHLAKKDLEENYRLLLDERNEYVKVLQTQVKLLKEGKDIPAELAEKIKSGKAKAEMAVQESVTKAVPGAGGHSEQMELLKAKVKRQEELLQKCKDSIRNYKEKVVQLATEKQELLIKLEQKGDNASGNISQGDINRLQGQIREARAVIEQLESDREIAIAQVKQQVHEEMEVKDRELSQARSRAEALLQENAALQASVEKMQDDIESLKKLNHEQLEKAREIIRQLKEEKNHLMKETEVRVQQAEQVMEEEKEKLVQELSRGKAAAVSLIQQESEKQLGEKLSAAIEERDIFWQEKMAELERSHAELLESKERERDLAIRTVQEELQQRLKEKEEEVHLAIEERELQKMAAVSGLDQQKDDLLQKIELLNSEKIELTNELSKLREDTSAQQNRLQQQMEELKMGHSSVLKELSLNHAKEMDELRQQTDHLLHDRLEAMVQAHTEQLQRAQDQHDEAFQKSGNELEAFYQSQLQSVRLSMEQLLSEKKSQVESLESTVADLTSRLVRSSETLSQKEQELSEKVGVYEARVSEVQTSLNSEAERNKKLEKEMENLQTEIQASKGRLEEQITELKSQLEFQELSLSQAGMESQKLREDLSVLQEQNVQLTEQLSCSERDVATRLQDSESKQSELSQEVQFLRAHTEELDKLLKSKEEEVISLKQQIDLALEENKKIAQSVQNKEETLLSLHEELSSVTDGKTKLEAELQQKENSAGKEEEKNISRIAELEVRVQELQACCDASKQELNETRASNSAVWEEKASLEASISELMARLQNAQQEVDALLKRKAELEAQVSEREGCIQQLKDGVSRLQACQHVVESEKINLESKLGELEKIVSDLKLVKQDLSQRLQDSHMLLTAQAADEKEELNTHLHDALLKVSELEKKLASKDDEILALRTVIDDNSAFVKELETRRDELEKELNLKGSQIEELGAKVSQAQEKFSQLRAEAKTKIKDLKEENEQLIAKHNEEMAQKVKELEDLLQEKDAVALKLSMQEEEQRRLEVSFKEQFEERQNKYKGTLAKLKARFEEIIKQKDSNFEQKIQEIMTQKESGAEDLSRSLEELRKTQLQELQAKHSREMQDTIQEWENRLKEMVTHWQAKLQAFEDETSQRVSEKDSLLLASQQQVEVLQEKQNKELLEKTNTVCSLTEELKRCQLRAEQEQDKECLLQEMECRLRDAVETHQQDLIKKVVEVQECKELFSRLQAEHASMEEMLKAVNELALSKDEQITALTAQLSDVSYSSLQQVKDLQAVVEEKCSNSKQLEAELEALKSTKEGEVAEIHRHCDEKIRDIMSKSETTDKELQLHLKELNEKLTATEERLQDCIQSYDIQIEDYRRKMEQQKSASQEQITALHQQLKDAEARADVFSAELQALQQRVDEGEEKIRQQVQAHQALISSQERTWQEKSKELKAKYVASLKEIRYQGSEEVKKLQEELQQEKHEKEAVSSELTRANTRLLQLEESSGLSHETITDLEKTVEQLHVDLGQRDSKIEKLKQDHLDALEQLKQDLSDKDVELQKVRVDFMESEKVSSQLKEDVGLQNQRVKELAAEKDTLQTDKDTVIESQKQALVQVEARILQQQAEVEQWQKKAAELEEQLSEARQLFKQVQTSQQDELEELKQRLDASEVEKKELAMTVQALQGSQRELDGKLKQANEDCASLKHSSDAIKEAEGKLSQVLHENQTLRQDYEARILALQADHKASLDELTSKFENENSSKVSEYKKRAEAYIAQVKKQLISEKETAVSEHCATISKLSDEVAALKSQVSDLTAAQQVTVAECETKLKEQSAQHKQTTLKNRSVIEEQTARISQLESQVSQLSLQLDESKAEQSSTQGKLQELELSHQISAAESLKLLEEVRGQRDFLQKDLERLKCDKDDELDSAEKQRDALYEQLKMEYDQKLREQEAEHISKVKQLAKDLNRQLLNKEREFEETLHEAVEKSQRGEADLLQEHQEDIKDLRKMLKEKDTQLEVLKQEYQEKMEEQAKNLTECITSLQNDLSTMNQRHQLELWDQQERMKVQSQRTVQLRNTAHQEEVTALMKEWNQERKSGVPIAKLLTDAAISEDLAQQNHAALMAVQGDSNGEELLRQQVIKLSKQLEDLRDKHRLEIAELHSHIELSKDMVRPLVAESAPRTFDPDDPNLFSELQNLELNNMDLQAQLRHMNAELAQSRLREKDMQQRMDVLEHRLRYGHREDDTPPLSLDGSLVSHEDSALLREATEFEYLKNILYEYMMGRETKTLTRVIATVVRFSDEQTRNVLDKAESHSWLS